ncbi:MAG: transcription-repair coupling factor [Lachnospiraceae bacterium]|nr:transcription-repair coupling factor [Lachnospiraceae bacterium]
MNSICEPVRDWADYESVTRFLNADKPGTVTVSGCSDSQKMNIMEAVSDGFMFKIIATYSEARVREIVSDLRLYERNVFTYPAKDLIFFQADIYSNRLTTDRIKAIRRIAEGRPMTLVTTFDSLMLPMIPLEVYRDHTIRLDKKTLVEEKALAIKLTDMGYVRVPQVEEQGQFSVRGGIVDIFDLTEDNPYRIELWGDQIESMRTFDIYTQRSIENLESLAVFPASELILDEDKLRAGMKAITKEGKASVKKLRDALKGDEAHRLETAMKTLEQDILELGRMTNLESYIHFFYPDTCSLTDYFADRKTMIVIDEPARVSEHVDAVSFEFADSMKNRLEKGYIIPTQMKLLMSKEETNARCQRYPLLQLSTLENRKGLIKPGLKAEITVKSISTYKNNFEMLVKDLEMYRKREYRILLLSGSRTRAKRLAGELRDRDFTAVYTEDPMRENQPREVVCMYGNALKGFEYPLLKYVVISESDIFGSSDKKKKPKSSYKGRGISDFNELHVGDYVVHETHGLGVYKGIEKVEVDKVTKDYLKIEYRDGGNLYILATGLDAIQKYASVDTEHKPKLNKLGSKEWVNTKQKVREAVEIVAEDLVNLYAARRAKKGFVFGPDTVWQQEFEELFPYEETADQLEAVADTKRDMESDKIMDRLICGDVGYGKTEIALRAAFKAVSDGKQVAVLVPTTILAGQHYNTFKDRMKDFPIRVEMLSRFRTASEQKKVIEDLKKGMVDIVIGTHRLLSKDVVYKDLGLLVVDEEQRFGVTHKEKLKTLKEEVDVLTLSATPIPRTLHMSLVGIRDMSVLEEPPGERMPIQTFVCEYNEEMVREAIVREISRGGQVYYVYNKVSNIADIASIIGKLVPEANVSYAHGQMKENELERIMYDFVNGEIDVLVSTTIIETGLDISNVNTIIIHDSDKFGLSQLYQLRGRVGRSTRTAYAFLMYKRDYMLKEVAEKRLEAIKEFTDLGSGFRIALRDLEIRGAGNLLGRKQHGHMEAVGYDMYCKMLNEAVMRLKGEAVDSEEEGTQIDLDVDAFIPADYIVNEMQKLEIYKRIASIETDAEADDMRGELKDRFGKLPDSADNLLKIALMKAKAAKVYIADIKGGRGEIRFTMRRDAAIKVDKIPDLMITMGKGFDLVTKGEPYFRMKYPVSDMSVINERTLIEKTGEVIEEMQKILL